MNVNAQSDAYLCILNSLNTFPQISTSKYKHSVLTFSQHFSLCAEKVEIDGKMVPLKAISSQFREKKKGIKERISFSRLLELQE